MTAKLLDEEALFHSARRIADPGARALFIDQACGDNAELAERVRRLLEVHEQESESADAAPVQTAAFEPVAERAGSRVGPYLLREQIGEGGFGLVFVAEQQEPVKRKVALKIIKPGMDSRQVIARFEAERQALALMDHPNIARVLDAGSTDSGRPYFVMELVRGIPITDYCDQNHLTPKERLELFASVCHAIQHAHQKGIIHRDIKPSNVLVTSHDGKPVAKVIDFGVAKAIHQQLTDRTIYTNFAQMIGTPLYMSPEQAEMSGLDIDTRSDIYSLGVLLYELLTGSTPLEKKRFAKAAYDEIRRLIREEEPPKPSQRLSTSETLPSLAASRKTEPAKLSRMLKGELDWVVMKALEKDRTRRYETANGLARDIQRYLADEVVEARPPTTGYRLRKFARKNRAALLTAAAIVLLLVAGVAITGWQAWRAWQAERAALAERDEKKQALEAERKARTRTHEALEVMSSRAMEEWLSHKTEATPEQREFLEMTAKFYREFAEETASDPTSAARVAQARLRLSQIDNRLGRSAEAAHEAEAAQQVFERLLETEPHDATYRRGLSWALACRVNALHWLKRPEELDAVAERAIALSDELAKEDPKNLRRVEELSELLVNRGFQLATRRRYAPGLAALDRALPLVERLIKMEPGVERHEERLALTRNNRSNCLLGLERVQEADDEHKKSLELYEAIARRSPRNLDARHNAGKLRLNTGMRWSVKKNYARAIDEFRKAEVWMIPVVEELRGVPEYRSLLGSLYVNWSRALLAIKQVRQAEDLANRAVQIWTEQKSDALGSALWDRGNCRLAKGDFAEAERDYSDAIEKIEHAIAVSGHNQWTQDSLLKAYARRAKARDRLHRFDDCLADWDKAIEIGHTINPKIYALHANKAESLRNAGRDGQALKLVDEIVGKLTTNNTDPDTLGFLLVIRLEHFAKANDAAGCRATAEIMEKQNPTDVINLYNTACLRAMTASVQAKAKDRDAARLAKADADKAMAWLSKAVAAGLTDPASIRKDADLEFLRDREDFKKLLADLESKSAAPAGEKK